MHAASDFRVVYQIIGLWFSDENMKVIKQLNIPQLIVQGIDEHKAEPTLVKNGFLALAAIVEADGKPLNNQSTDRQVQFCECSFVCR